MLLLLLLPPQAHAGVGKTKLVMELRHWIEQQVRLQLINPGGAFRPSSPDLRSCHIYCTTADASRKDQRLYPWKRIISRMISADLGQGSIHGDKILQAGYPGRGGEGPDVR